MADSKLTVELLAAVLRSLDSGSPAPASAEEAQEREDMIRCLAKEALSGIAVCMKFLLAKQGEAAIDGLGTLAAFGGQIIFRGEQELLQYVLLSADDVESRNSRLAAGLIYHLNAAVSILRIIKSHLNMRIDSLDIVDDERLFLSLSSDMPLNNLRATIEFLMDQLRKELTEEHADIFVHEIGQPPRPTSWPTPDNLKLDDGITVSIEKTSADTAYTDASRSKLRTTWDEIMRRARPQARTESRKTHFGVDSFEGDTISSIGSKRKKKRLPHGPGKSTDS